MKKLQKRTRLKYFNYEGFFRYYLTINTNYKEKYFIDEQTFNQTRKILRDVSKKYQFIIWVYTFMSNHLHLLVEGESEKSNFKNFISVFKQKSSYSFKRQNGGKL